jgi:hypothetical protein
MDNSPIACTLTPAALKARKEGLLAQLVARADDRVDLVDGLRLRFSPSSDLVASIAAMIEAERQCCRFLRCTLTIEPEEGPISLDLTGPVGRASACRVRMLRGRQLSRTVNGHALHPDASQAHHAPD